MNFEELKQQHALIDKQIAELGRKKIDLQHDYVDKHAEFECGNRAVIRNTTKGKRVVEIVSRSMDWNGKIQYTLKHVKKDGTVSRTLDYVEPGETIQRIKSTLRP